MLSVKPYSKFQKLKPGDLIFLGFLFFTKQTNDAFQYRRFGYFVTTSYVMKGLRAKYWPLAFKASGLVDKILALKLLLKPKHQFLSSQKFGFRFIF